MLVFNRLVYQMYKIFFNVISAVRNCDGLLNFNSICKISTLKLKQEVHFIDYICF